MRLDVIGSGSEGNAYILHNEREALLLEAGMPFKKTLKALGGNVGKVVGCLVTHEHGDHAGHINEVLNYAIPVYATEGTIEGARKYIKTDFQPKALQGSGGDYARLLIGNFIVIPFATKHDSAQPVGFYIWHEETGGVLFATDTFYLPYTFAGLNNILIECNYDEGILQDNVERGEVLPALRERVRRSHLSYTTCLDALKANDLRGVNNIVLIHISATNGDPLGFREGIRVATGKRVHVAKENLSIHFNKTPF